MRRRLTNGARVIATGDLGGISSGSDGSRGFEVKVPKGTPGVVAAKHPRIKGWSIVRVDLDGKSYDVPSGPQHWAPDPSAPPARRQLTKNETGAQHLNRMLSAAFFGGKGAERTAARADPK